MCNAAQWVAVYWVMYLFFDRVNTGGMYKLQLQLLVLRTVGYYVGKKNILDASARDKLTSLIIKIILPSSIILSFQMELTAEMLLETMEVLLAAVDSGLYSCNITALGNQQCLPGIAKRERQK